MDFGLCVPVGIGDFIILRTILDKVRHKYDHIFIKSCRMLLSLEFQNEHNKFIDQITSCLFSEAPYQVTDILDCPYQDLPSICSNYGLNPEKPRLADELCYGEPLDISDEYIVMHTKTRYMRRSTLNDLGRDLWNVLQDLTKRYKLVVMGERSVEPRLEYTVHNNMSREEVVFSTYDKIMANVPNERIIDLSVPALGITCPNFDKMRQDCLIMKQAKFVITLGVGGGFTLATAVAEKVIGYRQDSDHLANFIYNNEYPDAIITKNWQRFVEVLHAQKHTP
jgi:hypothetical protein